jgi:hypothetical protein
MLKRLVLRKFLNNHSIRSLYTIKERQHRIDIAKQCDFEIYDGIFEHNRLNMLRDSIVSMSEHVQLHGNSLYKLRLFSHDPYYNKSYNQISEYWCFVYRLCRRDGNIAILDDLFCEHREIIIMKEFNIW